MVAAAEAEPLAFFGQINTGGGADRYDETLYEEEDPTQSVVNIPSANANAEAEAPEADENGPQETPEEAKEDAAELLAEIDKE